MRATAKYGCWEKLPTVNVMYIVPKTLLTLLAHLDCHPAFCWSYATIISRRFHAFVSWQRRPSGLSSMIPARNWISIIGSLSGLSEISNTMAPPVTMSRPARILLPHLTANHLHFPVCHKALSTLEIRGKNTVATSTNVVYILVRISHRSSTPKYPFLMVNYPSRPSKAALAFRSTSASAAASRKPCWPVVLLFVTFVLQY